MIAERTLTLTFDPPRKVGDREMVSLTFQAPRVGWRQKAEEKLRGGQHPEAQTQASLALLARCAGVDVAHIEELDEIENLEAMHFVNSFANEPTHPADGDETTRTVEFPAMKVDGREYSSLMLVKTKVGWRRQAEGHLRNGGHPEAMTKYAVHLVAKSAGLDERIIRELEDDYFFEAWGFVSSFLPGGQATGMR
jgi:hypothetical protein